MKTLLGKFSNLRTFYHLFHQLCLVGMSFMDRQCVVRYLPEFETKKCDFSRLHNVIKWKRSVVLSAGMNTSTLEYKTWYFNISGWGCFFRSASFFEKKSDESLINAHMFRFHWYTPLEANLEVNQYQLISLNKN